MQVGHEDDAQIGRLERVDAPVDLTASLRAAHDARAEVHEIGRAVHGNGGCRSRSGRDRRADFPVPSSTTFLRGVRGLFDLISSTARARRESAGQRRKRRRHAAVAVARPSLCRNDASEKARSRRLKPSASSQKAACPACLHEVNLRVSHAGLVLPDDKPAQRPHPLVPCVISTGLRIVGEEIVVSRDARESRPRRT